MPRRFNVVSAFALFGVGLLVAAQPSDAARVRAAKTAVDAAANYSRCTHCGQAVMEGARRGYQAVRERGRRCTYPQGRSGSHANSTPAVRSCR